MIDDYFMGKPLREFPPQELYRLLVQYGHVCIRPEEAIKFLGGVDNTESIKPAPLPTNCDNCGAPTTGPVCEYCGTNHARSK